MANPSPKPLKLHPKRRILAPMLTVLSRFLLSALVLCSVITNLSAESSNQNAAKLMFANNKYYLFNNAWGKDKVKGGTQTIKHNSDSDLGWEWNWPSTTNEVKAYPSLVSGWHWTDGYTEGSGFPTRLSDNKRVQTDVTYTIRATGTYDVAYDIWFHTTNKATYDTIPTDELMIWINHQKAGPLGQYVDTANIAGAEWKLAKGRINAGGGKGWNVYSFVRTINTSHSSLNVRDFTDYIVKKGWMDKSKYMSSVEFGTEIFGGQGEIKFTKWSVTVM